MEEATMANDHLLEWLDALNRKERYYLVNQALGGFGLAPQFRDAIRNATGVRVPSNAYAWMDYHLDWVWAALQLADHPVTLPIKKPLPPSPEFADVADGKASVHINQNQEDIDLLVGFRAEGMTHLLFIEAKGETAWSNPQMRSKVFRLKAILPELPEDVRPLLVLASPTKPQHLQVPENSPEWIAPSPTEWRYMELAAPDGRWKIERPDEKSIHWSVAPTSRSDLQS